MNSSARRVFRLGEVEIDLEQECVRLNGVEQYMRPKTFAVLVSLLDQRHRVVTKQELLESIWKDTAITDDGLVQCIVEIRRALGDDPRNPRFVKTLSKVGYRFIGPVKEIQLRAQSGKNRQRAALAVGALLALSICLWLGANALRRRWLRPSAPSIAVLPFLNLTPVPENRYLSDGLTEELTTAFAQLQELRVVARTSASQFAGKGQDVKQIGERLNVGAVIEGSIRQSGDQLRVTAQLISTRNGYHLWSKAYQGRGSDLFAFQEDIVRQAARSLGIAVPASAEQSWARRRTENPDAHDLYLQGRYFWSKRDVASMQRSVQLFGDAIQKDQNYALAYAGLADTYAVMAANAQMSPARAVPLGKAAAMRALELNPQMAEGHASLGLLRSKGEWDWRGGEQEFRRAIEINPSYATAHHWLGVHLTVVGRFEEADAELRKAQLLDPLSLMITDGLAENFYFWRRYDEALQQVKRLRLMAPATSGIGNTVRVWSFAHKGMHREAIAAATESFVWNSAEVAGLPIVAMEFAASGDRPRASEALQKLERASRDRYLAPSDLAYVYALLGDKDTAFRWFDKAYQEHDTGLSYLRVDPNLDGLRSDPRFMELVRKVRLSD